MTEENKLEKLMISYDATNKDLLHKDSQISYLESERELIEKELIDLKIRIRYEMADMGPVSIIFGDVVLTFSKGGHEAMTAVEVVYSKVIVG